MKVKINGVEFEGTPEEINELINLHGYKNMLEDDLLMRNFGQLSRVNRSRPTNLFKVGDYDFHDSPKCLIIT
ncbi:hypothetical protein [Bacillus phage SPbetaL3]|uniref:hypothetical protein n=1 Tax=Bacillus subtilis TaxID=1423 RepID=UPI00059E2BD5|nr:hypothetical protein [Bacillus subtilis]KIN27506.1 hypothetical protein B4069_2057 [Bacillus subtilis]KIN44619.1 hypothetical protein B4072_2134 [Bacillus subtilis]WIT27206.1 hypothetical protein [Bacillus phage SPbetaL3]